jgi:hypothetical protein
MYQRQAVPNPAAQAPVQAGAVMSRQAPQAAGAAKGAIVSMLEVSLARLEEIVDQETAALKTRGVIDLNDFNNRKSQALLELTRMLRSMPGVETTPETSARVGSLKAKLAVNQQALKMHLEAVREISTTLSDAIRNAESDGTYTQAISSVSRRS